MARYTIELKDIVETHNIFDFAYPFYDERKRADFERSFIRHFYFREIGCETIDRFKHYLNDKMNVVFPYYNELFKSASIEYDVLDNYKLTETYERKVENTGKSSGISSTVGQVFDKAESETKQNKTVDTTGEVDTVGKDTTKETGNETTDRTGEVSTTTTDQSVKKFLDTPQGLTDLSDSKYLTNLTQDNGNGTQTVSSEELTQTDSQRNVDTNTTTNTETTGKETTADNVEAVSSQETKTTADNNTRAYTEGEQKESYTLTRRGNIGVDTDSDAIEKHNRLQKTLKNIEKMFFDECEDLFMLVF